MEKGLPKRAIEQKPFAVLDAMSATPAIAAGVTAVFNSAALASRSRKVAGLAYDDSTGQLTVIEPGLYELSIAASILTPPGWAATEYVIGSVLCNGSALDLFREGGFAAQTYNFREANARLYLSAGDKLIFRLTDGSLVGHIAVAPRASIHFITA